MKIKRSSLFILLVCLASLPCLAQEKTNRTVLNQMHTFVKDGETVNRTKAMSLAKEKGWPLTLKDRHNNTGLLVGVDITGHPVYLITENNVISAATIGASQLWDGGASGLNLFGSSNAVKGKIAIWDGGSIRNTHVEFANRALQKDANPLALNDHSTHVAGTMVAKGVNPLAKGMAYGAQQLIAYDFNGHNNEMIGEAPNLLVSNHSYGTIAGWNFNQNDNRWEYSGDDGSTEDYKFGYYNADAQLWDSIAFNAPFYLIVKSAGNNRTENGPAVGSTYWGYNSSGTLVNKGARPSNISSNDSYDIIPTYGNAKNILTVGAIEGIPSGFSSRTDAVLADFSSWGPTDDGRIKPDVVANGVDVLSPMSGSDNAYGIISGTSMAAPSATGSVYLLQEYYTRLHPGEFMRSATLKGLIIHTADDAGPNPGPDYQFGWGVINVAKAAAVITANNSDKIISESTLINGNTQTETIIASGKEPLVVTLSWTDPKGDVNTSSKLNNPAPKLVHDLDVRVKTGSGPDIQPWTLDPINRATAAKAGDNILDNIEKIEIPNPIPGATYTITISHKSTLARGSQAYSLIVSGAGGTANCASASITGGPIIQQFTVGGLNHVPGAGCVNYLSFPSPLISGEISSSLPFTMKLSDCSGITGKMAKIFIDFNNNGNFTDAGETVATSALINGNGDFTGNIAIPATVAIGATSKVRVVVQQTTNAASITPCGTYAVGATYDYSITFKKPAFDVKVSSLVFPLSGDCANATQRVTLRLRNLGIAKIDSFPVNITVKKAGVPIVSNLNFYRGKIDPSEEVLYTAPLTFNMEAGANYTIEANSTLTDQNPSNDAITAQVTVAGVAAPPTGSAVICSTTGAQLKSTSPGSLLWYSTAAAVTPVASGQNTTTSVVPANNTFYLGKNDFRNVPAPTITSLGGSSFYTWFRGFFNTFTNSVPVVIESFRIFSRSSGKAEIIVADIPNYTPGQSFSYFPISKIMLDVQQSRNPQTGNDTGLIYQVNLPVEATGNHAILMSLEASSTLSEDTLKVGFTVGTPNLYPIGTNFFKMTGNNDYTAADPNEFQKYYYMTYDMNVRSYGCASTRVPIVATSAAAPVITQSGNILSSNVTTNIQWYRNNEPITGEVNPNYTIVEPGVYKVITTNADCNLSSNEINALVTAVADLDNPGQGLLVSPNPSDGNFQLAFSSNRTGALSIVVYNALGQVVYNESRQQFTGGYQKDLHLNVPKGVYLLKVQHGKKSLTQKIIIRR